MNENKVELTKTPHLRYWVQHILPLVYDDSLSYMELLAKVVYKLNEMIQNNNNLPEYIKGEITEYINSDLIKQVVTEIVSNVIIDVTNPPAGLKPAVGDNVTDNTEALQAIFDYANENAKDVYFPKGNFLTKTINAYAFNVYGAGKDKTWLIANVADVGISTVIYATNLYNLSIDGRLPYQPPNINLVNIVNNGYRQGTNFNFKNCHFTNGFFSNVNTSAEYMVYMENCEVDGKTNTEASLSIVAISNKITTVYLKNIKVSNKFFLTACRGFAEISAAADGSFTSNLPLTIIWPYNTMPSIVTGENITIINTETGSYSHKNVIVNAPGDLTINAGDVTESAEQKTSAISGDVTKTIEGKYKANIAAKTEIKGENSLFSISRNDGKTSINITDTAINEQSTANISRAIGTPTQPGYINESITPGEYKLNMEIEDGVCRLRLLQNLISLTYKNAKLGINNDSIQMAMENFIAGLIKDGDSPAFIITKGNNINDILFSATTYLMSAYFPTIKIEVGDRAEATTGFKVIWDNDSFNMIYPINNTKPCLRLDKDYFTIAPPIKYRTPESAGIWYDTIPVVGEDGNTYYAMVKNDSTPNNINGGSGAPTLINTYTNPDIITITKGGNNVINIGAITTPGTYAIQVNVESDSNYVNVFKLVHGVTKLGTNIIAPTQEGKDNASGSGFYMFKFEGTPTQPLLNLTIYNYDQTNDMHVAIAGIDIKIWKF